MTITDPAGQAAAHDGAEPGALEIVPAAAVGRALDELRPTLTGTVAEAYRAHDAGRTVNPASGFLRFPSTPDARIISLPASLEYGHGVAGVKWIASFPGNVARNRQRASAVLVLNDRATGYPVACLEAGRISAARTAASAVLGAEAVTGGRRAEHVLVVGGGVIARTVVDHLLADGWSIGRLTVLDTVPEYAQRLADHAAAGGIAAGTVTDPATAAADSDLVVFATTAPAPWYEQPLPPGQTVLELSLRDLPVSAVLGANNIVDDVDHCLTAATSVHLAEQQVGHREFVSGTLAGLLRGEVGLDPARPTVFSPFGLGVLDLAVGVRVLERARAAGDLVRVDGFLGDPTRW
ncbi:2,3-diaminopropionate biosynthesis protein SbnB [Pseudonocardia sp. ICBG1293]|uniref:2,3-diaminopropionate biosynthesis protein SbnB n=1 Tax=Pseudonocardia sp. ICBG1293 TaxID=2844382 RepID=UPI001CCBAC86|nr:2,3-diaminopropionate biosynthesis protein SbnB [Pseudonocardia sp. ICBG1293]